MKPQRSGGFTLIELMVVVAIVAILAAIAIPAYTEQARKGRRADAVRAIGELQLNLERWRAENPSYANCTSPPTPCGFGTYPTLPTAADSPYYALTIPTATATGYSILATRRTGSAQATDRCGNYTFTNTAGVLTKSASGGSNRSCSL